MTVTSQNQSPVSYNSATANGCNHAGYISDVTIPDETVLAPGESFNKTWEFQNTGTWRLTDEAGNILGQSVYVLIVVSEDAATLEPVSTSTPTSSSLPSDLIADTPASTPAGSS
ncbi:MAG: hypothetical protein ACM3XO_10390 [Bacteroidota bacterium]